MALAGNAFLALWNDIARAREAEYDRWHTQEHVPERVAVTGFHGARRYVNRARDRHRYFTIYDVADIAVFNGSEYRDIVLNPTPWTATMRPDFANFLRAPCTVAATQGDGIGAAVAVICHEHTHALAGATMPLLSAIRALPGVVGCSVGECGGDTMPAPWAKVATATAPARAFDRVLLIEALDRDAAAGALTQTREALGLDALPVDFGNDVYDLAFVFPSHDPDARRRHRRSRWDG